MSSAISGGIRISSVIGIRGVVNVGIGIGVGAYDPGF